MKRRGNLIRQAGSCDEHCDELTSVTYPLVGEKISRKYTSKALGLLSELNFTYIFDLLTDLHTFFKN